jgi:multicomponent Na+:H+ antiporter subunit B
MELAIIIITAFMIAGAIYAIHAKDLLSAVIACGIVGYGLVICFLLLKAPDLAIVQIVVDTVSLIIMVAVVLNTSRNEPFSGMDSQGYVHALLGLIIMMVLLYFYHKAISNLDNLGISTLRMSDAYVNGATERTGSANLVTGVVFDFRGYDTLGEATVLVTTVLGVIAVLRLKGKKAGL